MFWGGNDGWGGLGALNGLLGGLAGELERGHGVLVVMNAKIPRILWGGFTSV